MIEAKLKTYIRDIPDFPKEGIIFKDISTLLIDPVGMKLAIDTLTEAFKNKGITKIASVESRGFIFGVPMAYFLDVGFVMLRKPGKLPYTTFSEEYDLEYGTDSIEVHTDAFDKNDKVLIIDDLLATGGTALAAAKLIEKCGAKVAGFGFIIELDFLNGKDKLSGYDITSIIHY